MPTHTEFYDSLPTSALLARMEETIIDESEDQLDDDRRTGLKDRTPDDPFLESDQPTGGSYDPRTGESRSGSRHSRSKLATYHGGYAKPTSEAPYTDGKFLDHEFLVADPDGWAAMPNMSKTVDFTRRRADRFQFYSDEDHTTTGGGISDTEVHHLRRQVLPKLMKPRTVQFSTSRDYLMVGFNPAQASGATMVQHTTADGSVVNITDSLARQRQNSSAILSGIASSGMTTPDHEFAVADYSQIRAAMPIGQMDARGARQYTEIDESAIPVEYRGQYVPHAVALTMANYMINRRLLSETAEGVSWGDSAERENRDFEAKRTHGGGAIEVLNLIDMDPILGQSQETKGHKGYNATSGPNAMLSTHEHFQVSAIQENAVRAMRQGKPDDDITRYLDLFMPGVGAAEMQSTPQARKLKSDMHAAEITLVERAQVGDDEKEVQNYSFSPVMPKDVLLREHAQHNHSTIELKGASNKATLQRQGYGIGGMNEYDADFGRDKPVQVYSANPAANGDKQYARRLTTHNHMQEAASAIDDM